MKIDGKVAGIVSPTMVAINVGKKQGVKVGDKVRVYRRVDVQDPDSHEELGVVELTKIALVINMVGDRFAVAETGEVARRGLTAIYAGLGESAPQMKVTLNAKEAATETILIAIGDPVFVEREDKTDKKEPAEGRKQPPDRPTQSPPSS